MGLAYPLLALVNLIAGGFLIAAVFGFSDETATELGFAVSIGVMVFGLAMVWAGQEERESAGITALGLATAFLAGWTVIATSVYDASTAQWLVLASGIGHVVLSVAGLVGDLVARDAAIRSDAKRRAAANRRRKTAAARTRKSAGGARKR